jgi:hypothetical protein
MQKSNRNLGLDSSWAPLYIRCPENKDEVCSFIAEPMFRIVGTVNILYSERDYPFSTGSLLLINTLLYPPECHVNLE